MAAAEIPTPPASHTGLVTSHTVLQNPSGSRQPVSGYEGEQPGYGAFQRAEPLSFLPPASSCKVGDFLLQAEMPMHKFSASLQQCSVRT